MLWCCIMRCVAVLPSLTLGVASLVIGFCCGAQSWFALSDLLCAISAVRFCLILLVCLLGFVGLCIRPCHFAFAVLRVFVCGCVELRWALLVYSGMRYIVLYCVGSRSSFPALCSVPLMFPFDSTSPERVGPPGGWPRALHRETRRNC